MYHGFPPTWLGFTTVSWFCLGYLLFFLTLKTDPGGARKAKLVRLLREDAYQRRAQRFGGGSVGAEVPNGSPERKGAKTSQMERYGKPLESRKGSQGEAKWEAKWEVCVNMWGHRKVTSTLGWKGLDVDTSTVDSCWFWAATFCELAEKHGNPNGSAREAKETKALGEDLAHRWEAVGFPRELQGKCKG